jgi:hypothetical protein
MAGGFMMAKQLWFPLADTPDVDLEQLVGRAVNAERPAGVADRRSLREIKQLEAIAEQHVILRHATRPFITWR